MQPNFSLILAYKMDSDDPTAARKLQKAGREKLRRDRLNEQFIELGKTLDADRPKNDKATILADTIQLLQELTAEVNKLKSEHAALSEESGELTQEKNDMREEKGALKSDIERLNAQCRRGLGSTTYPWVAMDHSVFSHQPSYPYPVPIPMHPSMQPCPYPFFASPSPGIFPNPCSTFIPYMNPNTPSEHQSSQFLSSSWRPGSGAHVLGRQSSDKETEKQIDKNRDSNDVATDLELKTRGSTTDEDKSSGEKKSKKLLQKKSNAAEGSSSSRCSSSQSVQDSSSKSVAGGGKIDN